MQATTASGDEGKSAENMKWNAEELGIVEKPNGPAAAALIGAGLGVLFLGLFTTLSEVSTGLHDWLSFEDRVGPLSGKTTMAVVLWLVAWALVSVPLWRRNLSYVAVTGATVVLVVLGLIGTFPKFFQLFAE